MTSITDSALNALWGKSDAGGRPNLLLQHLLDAAAVGELLWDRYLSENVKRQLDDCCAGRGRSFFALLCGLHDVGKATPAFHSKVAHLARRVREAGLTWRNLDAASRRWHHSSAGAVIVRRVLAKEGWSAEAIRWVWPMIAGHHGVIPPSSIFQAARRLLDAQGRGGAWESTQETLVRAVAEALDVKLPEIAPAGTPRRGCQLALSGVVIMADWIASGEHFIGIDNVNDVGMAVARERAATAWAKLELRGGWGAGPYQPAPDLMTARFGKAARPLQLEAVALAERMSAPGLLFIEAPMGEGKTEAALAAAEVLAKRFGCDGVFIGMPTQATSDPMFERVLAWADRVEAGLPVGLLHGKRMFNPKWNELLQRTHFAGIDEFGCDDEFGLAGSGTWKRAPQAPAEWFLGPKRGMLMPITVGTVDNLLHAATRTRHVMLRHAGLANRVVILDEVHAYDVYMSQFLSEALRWLADMRVPVVLLSATLPAHQRERLTSAYLQGAQGKRQVDVPALADPTGYPAVRAVSVGGGRVIGQVRTTASWRPSSRVAVQILAEAPDDGPEAVADLLVEELSEGGCALVIRNTVSRAQRTYAALKERLGTDEVVLLHSRLTAGERAARTQRVLDQLGAPAAQGDGSRPSRLIVVATQVAEQSFDVDADLLVTDLAPIDLLLQRVGRVHRHERRPDERPERLRQPKVVIAGVQLRSSGPPSFPRGSEHVYGRHLLLRTAALVIEAERRDGWLVPTEVPELVARVYGTDDLVPPTWQEAASQAEAAWESSARKRRASAERFLLSGEATIGAPTLAGLHERAIGELPDDDAVAAVVRDGPETVEVVLVRFGAGGYRTLSGRSMGPNGDGISDAGIADEVIGSTIRLPPVPAITEAAKTELGPLPGWLGNAWLQRSRALTLDENLSTLLGGHRLTYDSELGLVHERAA